MAKRHLSQQQKQRIAKGQSSHLQKANAKGGTLIKGRVYARYSRHALVKPLANEQQAKAQKCHIRANINNITVGDIIAYRQSKRGQPVVEAVEPRSTEILRPDGLGKLKAVAANIDQVFIVMAPMPEPAPTLVDRYLVAAENAGLKAFLLYNKADLGITDETEQWLEEYKALGYSVLFCSSHDGFGIAGFHQALKGFNNIVVGQSGVGKSSLLNALLPAAKTKVGALSEAREKGRHTTTSAQMFALPEGGFLIDSPGIREFHLNHLNKAEVYRGFVEFDNMQEHCRYRNCSHLEESGCAYEAFIEKGGLSPSRQQSLYYILNAMEAE